MTKYNDNKNNDTMDYINKASENYRDWLIDESNFGNHNEYPTDLSAIVKTDLKVKKMLSQSGSSDRLKKQFLIFSFMYLAVSFIFFISFFIMKVDNFSLYNRNYNAVRSNVFLLGSVLFGFISVFFFLIHYYIDKYSIPMNFEKLSLFRIRNKKNNQLIQVVYRWRDFESIAYYLIPNSSNFNGKKAINVLLDERFISTSEADVLLDLLMLRNDSIHKGTVKKSRSQVAKVLKDSTKIINRLNQVFKIN